MTEAYGSQFVNQFGAEPLPAWVAGLSGLTDEQIQTGYTRAIEDNREFVPNLSVLLNYCTNQDDWESKRLHKVYDPSEQLPDLGEGRSLEAPQDDRTPEQHLAEMKAKVGLR